MKLCSTLKDNIIKDNIVERIKKLRVHFTTQSHEKL